VREFIDQMQRRVRLERSPQRIVSLVPSQTELLFELGLGDRVAGITDYCPAPKSQLPTFVRVGGTKRFLFDRIDEVDPDLVIGNREENYKEGIERLAARYPVWMSDVLTLEDALAMICAVGDLVEMRAAATRLAREIAARFAALPAVRSYPAAYLIWRKPWMAAGPQTFIDDMLCRTGFANVFADRPRYPEFTLDELRERAPHAVLLSSEPFPFTDEHEAELDAALPGTRLLRVDAMPFSWYGSRLLQAPGYLQHIRTEL